MPGGEGFATEDEAEAVILMGRFLERLKAEKEGRPEVDPTPEDDFDQKRAD